MGTGRAQGVCQRACVLPQGIEKVVELIDTSVNNWRTIQYDSCPKQLQFFVEDAHNSSYQSRRSPSFLGSHLSKGD